MSNDTAGAQLLLEPATDEPTSVYLYYDVVGLLLYVGITSRRTGRQAEHNADKTWWPYVVRQEIEHYGTRSEALSRESSLIAERRPPFNTQHNPNWRYSRTAYEAMRPRLLRDPLDLAQELDWAVPLSIRAVPGSGDTGALTVEDTYSYRRVFLRTTLGDSPVGSRLAMNAKRRVPVRGRGGKVIGEVVKIYSQGALAVMKLHMDPQVTFTSASALVDPKKGSGGGISFHPWMVRCHHDQIGRAHV